MKHVSKRSGEGDMITREMKEISNKALPFYLKNGWKAVSKSAYERHLKTVGKDYKYREAVKTTCTCAGEVTIKIKGVEKVVKCKSFFKYYNLKDGEGKVLPKDWQDVPDKRKPYNPEITLCPECALVFNYTGEYVRPYEAPEVPETKDDE